MGVCQHPVRCVGMDCVNRARAATVVRLTADSVLPLGQEDQRVGMVPARLGRIAAVVQVIAASVRRRLRPIHQTHLVTTIAATMCAIVQQGSACLIVHMTATYVAMPSALPHMRIARGVVIVDFAFPPPHPETVFGI